MTNIPCPLICIDGPSGAGKGTLARKLADHLGFSYLDSGAIYRVLAVLVQKQGIDLRDIEASLTSIVELAENVRVQFANNQVLYQDKDLSPQVRLEETGKALVSAQRAYAQSPGLVADGRDMGTTIFPDAPLKIYLIASAEERAKRRLNQLEELEVRIEGKANNQADPSAAGGLKQGGSGDRLRALVKDIELRDERDMNRPVSPLIPAEDAISIDCTSLSAGQVFDQVLSHWENCQLL